MENTVLKCFNSKMAVFIILMLVTSRSYLNPLREFSVAVNYPVSWCVFPFVMCSFTYLIIFWFGVIYVNSDVPFMQHVNMYHAIRSGRRQWGLGQIGVYFTFVDNGINNYFLHNTSIAVQNRMEQ